MIYEIKHMYTCNETFYDLYVRLNSIDTQSTRISNNHRFEGACGLKTVICDDAEFLSVAIYIQVPVCLGSRAVISAWIGSAPSL